MAGWAMVAASTLSFSFNLIVMWIAPEWSPDRMDLWMMAGNMIPFLGGLIVSLIYVGRL